MLRCKEIGLTFDETEEITMGMVLDMLVEKNNDSCEYAVLADQSDFDKF